MMKIRKLTVKDHEQVFALFSRGIGILFPEYSKSVQQTILNGKRYWSKENYRKRLKNKERLLLGAFIDETLMGFLDVEHHFGGVSLGVWLMVLPEFQKQGIAKRLVQRWEQEIKKRGGHLLYLYSPDRNRAFYRKLGFTEVGLFQKGWFGLDEYIFSKLIQEPNERKFLTNI